MKREFEKYTFWELYNILHILTVAIRICRKNKTVNKRFWQIVGKREAVIAEMDFRRR